MGTNYFAVRNRPTVEEPIHIGKSSAGWRFLFHRVNMPWHDPPIEWNTFPQVKGWLSKSDYLIFNEYDEEVSLEEFCEMVERKQSEPNDFGTADNADGYRFYEGWFR